ncbi:MAG TPA: LPS export ABC transporter permease LptG [Pseudorhodoplanes sp.]|jgi:lipopolysaccharide export system permease protein|nr:LPS export ABC transporter permease LptG [Pseudorhodoplanes sp.]
MFSVTGTLPRYFGLRFMWSALGTFVGVLLLVSLVDYIEMMRRTSSLDVSALVVAQTSFFRVPQITERILPFCIMVGTMSCYLGLSRRLELVVARSAGMSAWGFVAPSIIVAIAIGIVATALYNPLAAALQERSKQLEAEMFGETQNALESTAAFWIRQRANDGQSIINARSSREQGALLSGVTAFVFDQAGKFTERVEAKRARLEPGHWRLDEAKVYSLGSAPTDHATYRLPTNLTPEQVREKFATPETVPFWQLPGYIEMAERAGLDAAGYRLQYQKLLARPLFLGAMVLLAAAFSLRFFRMGGVQTMVLAGVATGFAFYVLSKVTDDLAKAELMSPIWAAWLPVVIGGLIGCVALLYQEDG